MDNTFPLRRMVDQSLVGQLIEETDYAQKP